MKQTFAHAVVVAFLAIVVTLGIYLVILAFTGKALDGFAVAMCIVCPVLVAFPVTAYNHNQRWKVAQAHAALTAAHRELAAMHKRLAEKARRDDMTGLLNRAAFISAVEEMCTKETPGAFLLIDADNFKQINDTFGHLSGDDALCKIARNVEAALRGDDLKGRLGGEEFGVFVAGATFDQASLIAERIREIVERTQFRVNNGEPAQLTVSIGVTIATKGATFSSLMDEADKRLYEAKRLGRNLVVMSCDRPAAA